MKEYVVGSISVKSCLEGKKRLVEEIFVAPEKRNRNLDYIVRLAHKQKVKVTSLSLEQINQIKSGSGGIIALVGERQYDKFNHQNRLCLLEGIEDPFNFGYCLRSLYAAGFEGVLVPERNWLSASETVVRSSGGASEFLDIICYKDIADLKALKGEYLFLAAQRSLQAQSLFEIKISQKCLLIIGGEKRGISRKILELADIEVFIPYQNNFKNALNVSSAVTLFAFVIASQV